MEKIQIVIAWVVLAFLVIGSIVGIVSYFEVKEVERTLQWQVEEMQLCTLQSVECEYERKH